MSSNLITLFVTAGAAICGVEILRYLGRWLAVTVPPASWGVVLSVAIRMFTMAVIAYRVTVASHAIHQVWQLIAVLPTLGQ